MGATGGAVRIRPGVCSVALRALDDTDVVDAAVAAGLDGIEWGADVHVPPGDLDRAATVARRCADAGLAVPSYGSYLRAGDGVDAAAVLDTAAALGASNVRVWAGDRPSADADAGYRRVAARDLAAWSIAARERGLTLSLEFHGGTLTDTAASTAGLLVEAASSGAPEGHLFTYWQPRDGEAGARDHAELAAVAGHLSHVHVFWWRSWWERFDLAAGAGFWRVALDVAAGATGGPAERWAFIEFVAGDDPAQLVRDGAALRSWL